MTKVPTMQRTASISASFTSQYGALEYSGIGIRLRLLGFVVSSISQAELNIKKFSKKPIIEDLYRKINKKGQCKKAVVNFGGLKKPSGSTLRYARHTPGKQPTKYWGCGSDGCRFSTPSCGAGSTTAPKPSQPPLTPPRPSARTRFLFSQLGKLKASTRTLDESSWRSRQSKDAAWGERGEYGRGGRFAEKGGQQAASAFQSSTDNEKIKAIYGNYGFWSWLRYWHLDSADFLWIRVTMTTTITRNIANVVKS